jgi:hypothetical protein
VAKTIQTTATLHSTCLSTIILSKTQGLGGGYSPSPFSRSDPALLPDLSLLALVVTALSPCNFAPSHVRTVLFDRQGQ